MTYFKQIVTILFLSFTSLVHCLPFGSAGSDTAKTVDLINKCGISTGLPSITSSWHQKFVANPVISITKVTDNKEFNRKEEHEEVRVHFNASELEPNRDILMQYFKNNGSLIINYDWSTSQSLLITSTYLVLSWTDTNGGDSIGEEILAVGPSFEANHSIVCSTSITPIKSHPHFSIEFYIKPISA